MAYIFVIFDALIQFSLGYNLFGYSMSLDDGLRISGVFNDIHILGFYISYITPVIIALILFERNFFICEFIIFTNNIF